jgi:hypothetical protein
VKPFDGGVTQKTQGVGAHVVKTFIGDKDLQY